MLEFYLVDAIICTVFHFHEVIIPLDSFFFGFIYVLTILWLIVVFVGCLVEV